MKCETKKLLWARLGIAEKLLAIDVDSLNKIEIHANRHFTRENIITSHV